MRLLSREREILERYSPGLDGALRHHELQKLEQPGSPALELFRKHGGARLLVPEKYGGCDAAPLEAIAVLRALGARSPSLAVAATMHNLSIAVLVAYDMYRGSGRELLLSVVERQSLVASGFAEGRSGADIFDAQMRATRVDGGYRISGSKKPCSLSRSMDFVMAGVAVVSPGAEPQRGIAIVSADSVGIRRRPFWGSWILAGAESDELILDNVFISEEKIIVPESGDSLGQVRTIEIGGLAWFELLVSSAYLGVASALVERVVVSEKGSALDRCTLGVELDGAMAALEGCALRMERDPLDLALLSHVLCVRYAVQRAIERVAMLASEILGGMAFVQSSDVAYLMAAARALAFHPPSRTSAADDLCAYLQGAAPADV